MVTSGTRGNAPLVRYLAHAVFEQALCGFCGGNRAGLCQCLDHFHITRTTRALTRICFVAVIGELPGGCIPISTLQPPKGKALPSDWRSRPLGSDADGVVDLAVRGGFGR